MGVGEEKVNVKELGQGIICFVLFYYYFLIIMRKANDFFHCVG